MRQERPCRIYTPEQAQFLKDNHVGRSRAELASMFEAEFGREITVEQVKAFVCNRGLNSGLTGKFEKGHEAWNRGKKGYMGANKTSFTKGNKPANWKPLGSERIDSKDGFILVKIKEQNPYTGGPTRYKHKHVWLWERKYGSVPAGMVVAFRDGDKENCKLRNLMLISRAELLRLNKHGYKEMPNELKPVVLALTKVEVKAFERSKDG